MLDQLSSETSTLQIKVHTFYQPPSSQQLIHLPFPIKGELHSRADTLNFPAMKAALGKIFLFCTSNFPHGPIVWNTKQVSKPSLSHCSPVDCQFWLQSWSTAKVTGQQPVVQTQLSVWFCKWNCHEADMPICLHTLVATFTLKHDKWIVISTVVWTTAPRIKYSLSEHI